MKEQIDHELKHIQFNFNMEKKTKPRKTKKIWSNILSVMCCIIIVGTTVHAGYNLYNYWVKLNGENLPELDSMRIVNTNLLSEYDIDDMLYRKQYDSYAILQQEIGVNLLCSDMSNGNASMLITRETDNEHWTQIRIVAYIVGDVTQLKKVSGRQQYTWVEGSVFSSPIDMTIDIISSQEQMEIGWEKEYLGPYEFVESFQTQDGYKVNILCSGSNTSARPMYQAVFVVDGIRYTLQGKVDIDILKEIINSFHY